MNEKYKKIIKEELAQYLPEEQQDAKIDIQTSFKINHSIDQLSIQIKENIISPLIPLEPYYQMFRNGENANSILEKIAKEYSSIPLDRGRTDSFINIVDSIRDRDPHTFLDGLYGVAINQNWNKDLLKTVPHMELEDLALIFRCRVDDSHSILINNKILENMEMTKEDLFQQYKMKNQKEKYSLYGMSEMLFETEKNLFLEEDIPKEMQYILRNEEKENGASVLFLPDVLEEAIEKIGEFCYLIPSSIHEILLMPASSFGFTKKDQDELLTLVKNVNQAIVLGEERLSNHIYFYDKSARKISMISSEKYLEQSEERLDFYVAECMEFPSMGEYKDHLTLNEAIKLYHAIPSNRMFAGKGIGFVLHNAGGANNDMEYGIYYGNGVDLDTINHIPEFKNSPLVQQAVKDVHKNFPNAEIWDRDTQKSEALKKVKNKRNQR